MHTTSTMIIDSFQTFSSHHSVSKSEGCIGVALSTLVLAHKTSCKAALYIDSDWDVIDCSVHGAKELWTLQELPHGVYIIDGKKVVVR